MFLDVLQNIFSNTCPLGKVGRLEGYSNILFYPAIQFCLCNQKIVLVYSSYTYLKAIQFQLNSFILPHNIDTIHKNKPIHILHPTDLHDSFSSRECSVCCNR
jgi:hypothetical protein